MNDKVITGLLTEQIDIVQDDLDRMRTALNGIRKILEALDGKSEESNPRSEDSSGHPPEHESIHCDECD